MIAKACVVTGAALGLLSSPAVDALHAGGPARGLPRGARGTATRGGQSLNAGSGFDFGEWISQAFNPPTKAAAQNKKGGR